MSLARVLLGFLSCTLWFALWREAERRLRGGSGDFGPAFRAALPALAIESGLLTLFAALWFGSLGTGGAVLLFLLVGALMEVPGRLRSHPSGRPPWKPIAGAVFRVLVAGLLLGAILR